MVVTKENRDSMFYDLSPLVITLQVAMMRNMKNGKNYAFQMEKVLNELSIIENSNYYDLNDINSFSNMIKNIY